jgi:protein phosphatase 2C
VISRPEVTVVPRGEDDECLVLASGGMWDVMSNEQACRLARIQILLWHKRNDGEDLDDEGDDELTAVNPATQAAADYLVKVALKIGSKDNITVTVIDLKPRRKIKVVNSEGK